MEEQQNKINQLQMFEQSLQNIMMQKQQFQGQLVEVNSALEQIEKTEQPYKIVGNIMVKTDKDSIKEDLQSKKEKAELRIKTMEKQESQIKEKAKKLQGEVMQGMEEEDEE